MRPAYFILPPLQVMLLTIIFHLANPYTRDVSAQEDHKTHSFFFIPGGAYYGKNSPNAFTRTYCGFISNIIFDELQDEGDSVTGMCGKSRVGASAFETSSLGG